MKIKLLSDQHSIANNNKNYNGQSEENDTLLTDYDERMERNFSYGLGNNQRRRSSTRSKPAKGDILSLDVLHDF